MPVPGNKVSIHISRFTCDLRDGVVGHFVPHETNGYLPHVLRHHVLTGYSVIAVLLKVLLVVAPTILPVAAVYSSAITSSNIIALTNVARSAVGLPDLADEPRLAQAAAGKAADIMEKQYMAHTSPEGVTPWDWIRGAGYAYRYAGENLALHYFTAEGAHDAWMASPTHRQNIVDPRYTQIGVAVQEGAYEGYDTVVVVQMFGTPKEEPVVAATASEEPVEPAPAPAPAVTSIPDESTSSEPAAIVAGAEVDAPTETQTPPDGKPVIDLSSVKVLPTPEGYAIAAEVPNAVRVEAYLGTDSVSLAQNAEGAWEGALVPSAAPADADYVFVGAQGEDGQRTYGPVAVVLPQAPTADVYAGNASRSDSFKLFGIFTVTGLEDGIRRFYAFGMLFLAAALLIKILVKIRIQHMSVIMHSLLVIGLFGTLLFV